MSRSGDVAKGENVLFFDTLATFRLGTVIAFARQTRGENAMLTSFLCLAQIQTKLLPRHRPNRPLASPTCLPQS